MKKIILISAAILGIFSIASCVKEAVDPSGEGTMRTVISAKVASTKTALGDKVGSEWPNYWKTDDLLSINGVTSDPLDSGFDGNATAQFTFAGSLTTPYCAAYPASAVSGYSAGSATVTVPATQNYVAGSYDPEAFLMIGKSNTPGTVGLSAKVSVIHLSLTGTVSVNSVKLTGGVGAALSGSFTTDYATLTPSSISNIVELVAASPVGLPADFFICVPAGLSGALQVEVFDNAGGSMTKNANITSALDAGKVFSPAAFAYAADSYAPVITAEGITSSTAVICWDNSPAAAYTISVYSDSGCSSLVNSYAVPAGDACWDGNAPRFCISGLEAGTTYYVKVTNVTNSADSDALAVTTEDFDIVEVTSTPAAVDDVILAEDFSEFRWDCDMIGNGAGFFPTSQDSFANVEVSSFQAAATSSEKQISAQTTALASSRLEHWAQGANPHMYVHPGYIKLVGQNKVTHLVTPALDNIPAGKLATLDIEVTASAYYSESSSSFCTTDAVVAVQTAEITNELVGGTGSTNTLDLTTNVQPITLDEATAWKTYKVTLTGVVKGNRLAFGAADGVTGNDARMNISDMKVTIKALEDPVLAASVKAVSSSTAAFTWTYGGDAADDIAKPYTIALYSDSGCSSLVVSYDIAADHGCWNSKTPCFVFGGLNPNTQYWFVATDTDAGISSDPVSATTEDFTPVDPTTVVNAEVGDVILAEDFSEIGWGSDDIAGAAGFVPSIKNMTIPSGTNPEGSFVKYSDTGSRYFGAGVDLEDSRLSHGWGFFGNSSVYLHNGYSRVGAKGSEGKAARTHVVTPALSGIPEGKLATIEVTVTATKYDPIEIAVFAEKGLTMNSTVDRSSASYRKYTGASLSDGHTFDITTTKVWDTKSVSISNVDSECQLIIGSLENYNDPLDSQNKNRFYISDVKVQITALVNDPVMKIKDEATFQAFVSAVETEKDIPAKVTQDINLSSAAAEAFTSIEDYTGTFDGNGKTITGLTKPLFNDLKGTAKDLTLNSSLNITVDQLDLGILANVLSGTADGCTSQGSVTFNVAGGVTGEHHIGGLIGKAAASGATITDCTNESTVTNETASAGGNEDELMVGGVLGFFWGTEFTISGCTNTGDVTNNADWNKDISVGGIIGQAGNSDGSGCALGVSNCTNSGTVTNDGDCDAGTNVGGIVGWGRYGTYSGNTNDGEIYNNGDAANNYIGGLIGNIHRYVTLDDNTNNGEISNSGYASTINYVGGLLGRAYRNNTFKNNVNTGLVSNSGNAPNNQYIYIGGIVGYLDKDNALSGATTDGKTASSYKLTNSGNIVNSGSAKNICIGGILGRNSSGVVAMTGSSSNYSSNSGDITDNSGNTKSNGGDLSIGGIAGYTTTGLKVQYARNYGNIYVTGDKGSTAINVGGIGGWISNASFNFNNCRNTGNVTIDATTSASIWAAGIVGCPKPNSTVHYYWRSNAIIDTHAATVGGENYTAGLMATVEGSDASSTFTMYGHRLAGTVWGSTTTTGLFCCTKNNTASFSLQGGSSNPNRIAPGTVRKDNNHEDTINDIADVTTDIIAGGAGSTYDIASAGESLVVEAW